MGKSLIIMLFGSVITFSVMQMSLLKTLNQGTKNAAGFYEKAQARNIGNSMINMLLSRLADNPTYRTHGFQEEDFAGGTVNYNVTDDPVNKKDTLIKIEVSAVYNEYPKNITTYVKRPKVNGWVPPVIRGSWTANGDLNNTISDMIIDGRNHDLNLNILPNSGRYGISSSVDFRNDDNALIGGTYNSVDHEPVNTNDSEIIEEHYSWEGNFPETPDEILGYPEGTLKSIAQSNIGGSQYLLNPSGKDIDGSVLKFPLKGVTYIELTDGKERQLRMKGNGNKGIVIVHGPGASSRLTGVKMEEFKAAKKENIVCHEWNTENERTLLIDEDSLDFHLDHGDIQESCGGNHTWFEGIIVTDYSFHHHIDILGSILQLSPNLETHKKCNGNADHWVKYSSMAIEEATLFAAKQSGLIGNNNNYYDKKGFGHGRWKVTSWYE
jgi:hypothetical protein